MKFTKQVIFVILALLWGICAVKLVAQPVAFVEYDDYDYVVTDIAFNEEGLIFVAKQDGTVFLEGDTLVKFPCWNSNEMGLVGLDYANAAIYAHVSGLDTVQRVIKYGIYTQKFDTIVEVDYHYPFNKNHRGGDIVVEDSILYCSFGYGALGRDAQDLDTYKGKLLKINLNTSVIDIVEFGLRNPYRFDFNFELNCGYIGDVGFRSFEEVNYFTGNYSLVNCGWPCFEGDSLIMDSDSICTGFAYSFPEFTYRHVNDGTAIIGGAYWDYNWYFCDHYTGDGYFMDTLLQEHKMPVPPGDSLPLKFPLYVTGMAVNPYTNELFICSWGGQIYVAEPLITSTQEPPHDEGVDVLLSEGPDIYVDVFGRIVPTPLIPGTYWNLKTRKRVVILDR